MRCLATVTHVGEREGSSGIRRVVPNLACESIAETRDFYVNFLGFELAMDMGWIVTVASPSNPTAQISLVADGIVPNSDEPVLTVEVADVERLHATAVARGLDIIVPLRVEDWGVQRFFVRDPDGRVINVMSHRAAPE